MDLLRYLPLSRCFCFAVMVVMCSLVARGQVLFFNDTQAAFARVEPWPAAESDSTTDDGTLEISLSFNTRMSHAFLFYSQSERGILQLLIRDRRSVHCRAVLATGENVDLYAQLNSSKPDFDVADGNEHMVRLRLSPFNSTDLLVSLSLDSSALVETLLAGGWALAEQATTDTYLGGLPHEFLTRHDGAHSPPRLLGCIHSYRVRRGSLGGDGAVTTASQPFPPVALLGSSAMDRRMSCPVCVDGSVTCSNGGRCRAGGVSNCHCGGTGHQGQHCQESKLLELVKGHAQFLIALLFLLLS